MLSISPIVFSVFGFFAFAIAQAEPALSQTGEWLAVVRGYRDNGDIFDKRNGDLKFHSASRLFRADAENATIQECGRRPAVTCKLMHTYFEGCYAVATPPTPEHIQHLHLYGGAGTTLDAAEREATRYCGSMSGTGTCTVRFSQCAREASAVSSAQSLTTQPAPAQISAAPVLLRPDAQSSIPFLREPFFWTTLLFGLGFGAILVRYLGSQSAIPKQAVARAHVGQVELCPEQPTSTETQPQVAYPVSLQAEQPLASVSAVIPPPMVVEKLPPSLPIALKLKRSQKQGALGGNVYMLDARIDVSAEVAALIAKHKLGSRLIYESEARQKHAGRVQAHLEGSRDRTSIFAPPSAQAMGAARTFWKLGRAAVSAARASLSLRVTVNSLLSGVHVECKSLEELLEAENAFREAKETLEGYISTAQTFDGREEIV